MKCSVYIVYRMYVLWNNRNVLPIYIWLTRAMLCGSLTFINYTYADLASGLWILHYSHCYLPWTLHWGIPTFLSCVFGYHPAIEVKVMGHSNKTLKTKIVRHGDAINNASRPKHRLTSPCKLCMGRIGTNDRVYKWEFDWKSVLIVPRTPQIRVKGFDMTIFKTICYFLYG